MVRRDHTACFWVKDAGTHGLEVTNVMLAAAAMGALPYLKWEQVVTARKRNCPPFDRYERT